MKRVAITRAEPEASRTAERVRALGAESIVAPLLTIEPRAFDSNTNGVQALLFTSANGVRAFAYASVDRDIAAVTVGEATAQAARDAGFGNVQSADGDSEALARFIITHLDPARGRVLHISGADVAGDLVGALAQAGFDAERRLAYEAVAAPQLPAALHEPCDIMLFHSARAARAFVRLGAPHANQTAAACLSPAVARAAADSPQGRINWLRLIVSPYPREEALLQAALAPTDASA
ncbi:MAG TPA: uroporphyrinogen-III synthase [Caulobacterales bacterium]|nr:uroporphyrinogen-III synthase [Caulobacterales bacterium]